MKKSRIIVLFLAIAAAGGAFVLATSPKAPAPAPEVVQAPVEAPTEDVLVAAKDMPLGSLVADGDMAWQAWPKNAVPAGMIRKAESADAMEALKGSIVRAAVSAGEPIRRDRLIKGNSLMSAILPAGMRAVAINTDSQGSTSAGSFVLPGDHVDVVRTFSQESRNGSSSNFISETILQNVLVLAIGQNVQEKNGQPFVAGSTATLQLDPVQAEAVILAQRTGPIVADAALHPGCEGRRDGRAGIRRHDGDPLRRSNRG